jgi:CheY-like chemotaxis protein
MTFIRGDPLHRLVIYPGYILFGLIQANVLLEKRGLRIKKQARNCEIEMTAMASASVPRKRILCVDDHEDTRDLMQVLLGQYGYEAVIAASVTDALETARSGGLALCILDHWITDGNGVELCQQIRAFDSHTPIMFYSGAGYRTDIQKGLDAGAQAYLVKPDFDRLKPTIDRLIDEAGFKQSVVM